MELPFAWYDDVTTSTEGASAGAREIRDNFKLRAAAARILHFAAAEVRLFCKAGSTINRAGVMATRPGEAATPRRIQNISEINPSEVRPNHV
jgi:hypothetical protein